MFKIEKDKICRNCSKSHGLFLFSTADKETNYVMCQKCGFSWYESTAHQTNAIFVRQYEDTRFSKMTRFRSLSDNQKSRKELKSRWHFTQFTPKYNGDNT